MFVHPGRFSMKKTGPAAVLVLVGVLAVRPLSTGSADRPATGSGIGAPAATWKPLGPEGGGIRRLVVNPADKTEIWALTGDSPALLFRSNDGGATWKRIAVAPEVLYDLICLPANSVLYALGDSSVYKSVNHGVSWTTLSLGAKNYGFFGRIALHPTNPNVLFVVGFREQADYRRNMAFFKSVNAGKTWSCQAFEAASLDGYLTALAVSPANPNVLLAAGYFTDSSFTTRNRIYRSLNGGKTWTDKTGPISDLIREIVAHPKDPKRFYLATSYNIWRTSNSGGSWAKNKGYARGYCLSIDPASPALMYAGTDDEAFRTLNGGLDWESSTTGLYGSIHSIAVLPAKVLCGSSAGVFATATGSGRDAWPSWTSSMKGLKAAEMKGIAVAPSSPNILYASVFTYGVFKTQNSGSSWKQLSGFSDGPYISRLAVHPSTSKVVFAMVSAWGPDKFYKSTDGGATWTSVMSDESRDFVLSDAHPDRIFIAGQTTSGSNTVMALHRSLDGGEQWSHVTVSTTADSCGYAVAVDPKNDSVVYLGGVVSGKGAIFKSTDQGTSWTDITGSLTGWVNDIAVDPKTTSRLYAATADGIWKSDNGGTTWTSAYASAAFCLFINPTASNIVYAGGYGGLFVSMNYGGSWADFGQGLTVSTNVIQLDMNRKTRTLYAACYGGSVWKRKI
jgi:photosystem II stability/assembly factor-like uncharacterized protein